MRQSLLTILFAHLLTACVYPKVALSTTERSHIRYKKRKTLVMFQQDDVNRSAVRFLRLGPRNGFERNFDFWWSRKVHDNPARKRGYYHSVNVFSDFSNHDKANSRLIDFQRISFVKTSDGDSLKLSIEGFEPVYVLNENTPDSLVFKRKEQQCHSCISEVVWEKSKGIVRLKKGGEWFISN